MPATERKPNGGPRRKFLDGTISRITMKTNKAIINTTCNGFYQPYNPRKREAIWKYIRSTKELIIITI